MKQIISILFIVLWSNISSAQKIKLEAYSSCAYDNFQLLVQRMQLVGAEVTPYGSIFTRRYSQRHIKKDIRMILVTNSISNMPWSDIQNGALENLGFKYFVEMRGNDTCISEKAMIGRYIYMGGYFQANIHLHNDTSIHCRFEIIYPRNAVRLWDCDGCSYTYAFKTFVPFLKYRFEFEDFAYISFQIKFTPSMQLDCN
jgi:hypothetical protein